MKKITPSMKFRLGSVVGILGIAFSLAFDMKKIPITSVTGVNGGSASLPCDVAHPKGDSIVLLLWFRDGKTTPIYRYDARSSSTSSSHWADDTLSARASLDVSSDPAFFTLKRLSPKDASFYKCRVDFLRQPTKTTRTYLAVVVPPNSVIVMQNSNLTRSISNVVGPYYEGDTLKLTCVAKGGDPRPQVVWFEDTRLLDNIMESQAQQTSRQENTSVATETSFPVSTTNTLEDDFDGDPYNTLVLGPLQRKHFKMLLTCEASNNNITLPTSLVVMVDIHLPPLGLNIKGPEQPLVAENEYAFICESFGGRPAPVIFWWLNGKKVTNKVQRDISDDGNVTRSRLPIVPKPQDDGLLVECVAKSSATNNIMEKSVSIAVHYPPQARIRFGASLDSTNIKEGDDIYFECIIEANPRAMRVSWRHNNDQLVHNITTGVIISNQSLVLQGVTRKQGGSYTCHAYNILGDGSSNSLALDIKFAPFCAENQVTTYAVSREEDAIVTCTVDANPSKASFQWTFNNTADTIDVPQGRYTTANSHSIITYTPITSLDYGTLLCWASNEIGTQREPCLYHIIPAGKPDSPSNCTVTRQLRTSVRVHCYPGSNGGFDQAFHLKVSHNGQPLMNLTSLTPEFKVDNLMPGAKYRLTITSENERGSSYATHLSATMKSLLTSIYEDGPSEAEVRDGSQGNNGLFNPVASSSPLIPPQSTADTPYFEGFNPQSLLPLAMGVGAGLVLVIIVLLILITMKARVPFKRYRRSRSSSTVVSGSLADGQSPDEECKVPESYSLVCTKKEMQPESDSDTEVSLSVVPRSRAAYSYATQKSSLSQGPTPSTLLAGNQYALSDLAKQSMIPCMETPLSISSVHTIRPVVYNHENQSKQRALLQNRPCISTTLPRPQMSCPHERSTLKQTELPNISRDLESMMTNNPGGNSTPCNTIYNDIKGGF